MVLTLAEALDVPLRDQNEWLKAAGFAAVFRETPIDAPQMQDVRAALTHILTAHLPNAAFVVDRRYSILMANDAATKIIGFFAPNWRGAPNLLEMMLSDEGLKPAVVNFDDVAGHVVHRVRTELSASARSKEDDVFLERTIAFERAHPRAKKEHDASARILVPITLRRGNVRLDLFTTITTLGTPLDITLQELRIETLFPANTDARRAMQAITTGS
ncbi:MAG TPA: hypothetical protein VF407_00890, partial [Polyangiaceae bacterium]